MYFTKETKNLLLQILNEATPPSGSMGGGFGGKDALSLDSKPKSKKETSPSAEVSGTSREYKKYISSLLKDLTGKDINVGFQEPPLELLTTLGAAKRMAGYSTDPNAAVELLTPGLARKKDASGKPIGGLAGVDVMKSAAGLVTPAAKLGAGMAALEFGMGALGEKLATKLPYLTALGVDPFDYATKIMGVDYVADQLRKLPARQQKAITSGAGNIEL